MEFKWFCQIFDLGEPKFPDGQIRELVFDKKSAFEFEYKEMPPSQFVSFKGTVLLDMPLTLIVQNSIKSSEAMIVCCIEEGSLQTDKIEVFRSLIGSESPVNRFFFLPNLFVVQFELQRMSDFECVYDCFLLAGFDQV